MATGGRDDGAPGARRGPVGGSGTRVSAAARGTAKVGRAAARGSLRAGAAAAGASGRAARGTARRIRRATYAQGAGESGLGRLIELHGVNSVGDALLTVSLAGTLFFAVPSGQARGRVALYLLVTLAPFAVVAPLIGPLLDRFTTGRRWAIAVTMAVRAFLVWTMASAVGAHTDAVRLYPAAFGCLIASKAYGVTRAAAVPRLLPREVSLVTANSRLSLAGLITAAVAAPVGAAIVGFAGPSWSLRLAFVVYVVGVVLSALLPQRVDSSAGEERASLSSDEPGRPRLRSVGPDVVLALRANAALRGLSGFLTLFLAFLLRAHPIGGLSQNVGFGLVAASAAAGGLIGTAAGALLRSRAPEAVIVTALALATVACGLAAIVYGLVTVVVVALVAGLSQAVGKLCLDALIQREIPEHVRNSAFARSETLLQLAWVVGGALGIVLPLHGALGLGIATAVVLAASVMTVRSVMRARAPSAGARRAQPRPQG